MTNHRAGGSPWLRLASLALVGCWPVQLAVAQSPPAQRDFDPDRPVRYSAQVGPTLSLLGCNAGGCHGKAGGQHGFALSLFGADSRADRQALAQRIDRDDPASSLLLLKPTGQIPHGGGIKLGIESVEYQTLFRWISQPSNELAAAGEARLVRLQVVPDRQVLAPRGRGQIRIEATWEDGSVVDVTRLSRFESNAPAILEAASGGALSASAGGIVGEAAVLVRYGPAFAVGRVVVPSGRTPAAIEAPSGSTIDRLVGRKLRKLGLSQNPPATDAAFARRSSVDIVGTLPDPAAVLAFEHDQDADKRERWIAGLLASPGYADHFATKWTAILRNRRSLGELSKPTTFAFHAWVRQAIAENRPYDRFVGAIVAARGDVAANPAVGWYRHVATRDERADDVAQVFLGTRIGCARCHHHPTERWGQDDYADFAAFFARVGTKAGADPNSFRVFHQPTGPSSATVRSPRPLGATAALALAERDDPRDALVAWMVDPANPELAQTVVNRYWKHFLGQGLVEPEDDFRTTNPPTDPELLDALTAEFRAHGFDLQWLIRTITTSQTYAQSSGADESTGATHPNLAGYTPRRLSAEVLLDAIDVVTGSTTRFAGVPPQTRAKQLPDDGFASPFLDAFGRPARRTACECERTIEPSLAQALFLLNSSEIEAKLADPHGRAARYARADDPRTAAAKVEELYRFALARPPDADEIAHAVGYLERHRHDPRQPDPVAAGFADLIWALINSREFLFNH